MRGYSVFSADLMCVDVQGGRAGRRHRGREEGPVDSRLFSPASSSFTPSCVFFVVLCVVVAHQGRSERGRKSGRVTAEEKTKRGETAGNWKKKGGSDQEGGRCATGAHDRHR